MRHKVTVTAKDCVRETFRCGGAGGQNVNKRDTGVRYRHEPSGAVGESTAQRNQHQNAVVAFRKMAESVQFKAWAALKLDSMEKGYASFERRLDEMMREENLVVESKAACMKGEAYCDKHRGDKCP
jgi:protein subunit release factor B